MNHSSWKEHVDRLSGVLIDGHDGEVRSTDRSDLASCDELVVHDYLADLLLIDALLANMSGRACDEREVQIRRVMDAISQPDPSPRPPARFLCWSSFAAVAGCLLIAITLSWIQFVQHSLADEVLLAVNEVSAEATDRIYAIRRVLSPSGDRDLSLGRLYLRGRSGFVITCGKVVLGRNADQFWLVAPNQQVTLSADFHWIDARSARDEFSLRLMQELSLESRHIPLMQLASVAELMQHDYDVTLGHGQLGPRAVDLLIGQRRSARSELPATIRLWSDIDSRIIQRAELSWEPNNAIILELTPTGPLPAEWYHYQTHCDGEPAVRRIVPGP
ncbi:MAG: hypothetical protein ACYC0X_28835 [Pirellulaceae bacterium]